MQVKTERETFEDCGVKYLSTIKRNEIHKFRTKIACFMLQNVKLMLKTSIIMTIYRVWYLTEESRKALGSDEMYRVPSHRN